MEETTLDQMEMESGSRRRRVSTLLLGGRPLDLQLSKHDIIVILLRSIGPANVSSTVVDDIFEQIDEDRMDLSPEKSFQTSFKLRNM